MLDRGYLDEKVTTKWNSDFSLVLIVYDINLSEMGLEDLR